MPNDTTVNDRLITFINYEVADESPIEIKIITNMFVQLLTSLSQERKRESILREKF